MPTAAYADKLTPRYLDAPDGHMNVLLSWLFPPLHTMPKTLLPALLAALATSPALAHWTDKELECRVATENFLNLQMEKRVALQQEGNAVLQHILSTLESADSSRGEKLLESLIDTLKLRDPTGERAEVARAATERYKKLAAEMQRKCDISDIR